MGKSIKQKYIQEKDRNLKCVHSQVEPEFLQEEYLRESHAAGKEMYTFKQVDTF